MFASWSVSYRIAMGFGLVLVLMGCLAAVNMIANQDIAEAFTDYRTTAQQTLVVNDIVDHLSAAQTDILAFRTSPSPERAEAVRAHLDAVTIAHDRIYDAFDQDRTQLPTLLQLLDKASDYLHLFDDIDRLQSHIDRQMEELDQRTAAIRRGYNALVFEATIHGEAGANLDVIRSKDDFFDARYAIGTFLRDRDKAAYASSESLLKSAKSTLDTLALRANDDIEKRVRDLIVELDSHVISIQQLHDDVIAQDTASEEALQRIGPALLADFSNALATVVDRQRDLGQKGTDRIAQTSGFVTILALSAVLIGMSLAWLIGRWVSRSVRNIADIMTELANENLDIEIAGREYRHEFGAMARALEIFRNNARRLRETLRKEQELNSLQRQFVAMVSHEFRTPLTIVDGNAYSLIRRQERLTPDSLKKGLEKIRSSVTRMTGLIESVLDAAHVAENRVLLEPERCSLQNILTELCSSYRDLHKDHDIITDITGLPDEIIGDRRLLHQTFSIILANACKYSSEKSRIWVTGCQDERGGIVISIRDEGLGIPPDEQEKSFERFYRASNSTGIAGCGIGLYLARHFIDLHDGRIEVTSQVDEGSTFTVRLPMPMSAAEAPPVAEAA